MHVLFSRCSAPLMALLIAGPLCAQSVEYLPGIDWPEPPVVTPGKTNADPPSDAVVLFDGKDLSAWEGADTWRVENGEAVVGTGMIKTKESFGDCQLHIEWSAPKPAKGEGQDRGNSGVFFMDFYEIQVLDSYHVAEPGRGIAARSTIRPRRLSGRPTRPTSGRPTTSSSAPPLRRGRP